MRKNRKRLQLSRETLRNLQDGALAGRVVGAAQSIDPEGCDRDLTIPDSVCNLCDPTGTTGTGWPTAYCTIGC